MPPPRWATTPPHILFEDENLRVVFRPGGSDWLLVTFADAATPLDGLRFFAQPVVEKHGLNCIGFMAKDTHWYPRTSMCAAVPEIAYTLRAFGTRLLHGSSMGAYAAIKYARLLGATHVVAYSPQWSIDPAECAENPSGYEGFFKPAMRFMAIRREDTAGFVNVFYDPLYTVDAWHVRKIEAECANLRAYRVPYAAHDVVAVLRGSDIAAAIWDGCRRDDVAQVNRSLAAARRRSRHRRQHVLQRLARTRPSWALRLIAALRAQCRLDLPHPPAVLVPLFRSLFRHGGAASALPLLVTVPSFLEGVRREVLLRHIRAPEAADWRRGLLTAHGTHLVYCVLEGRLLHVAPPADEAAAIGLFGVVIHQSGADQGRGCACLAIEAGGAALACARHEGGQVHLVPPDACPKSDMLCAKHPAGSTVQVRNRGFYLCAEPDGKLSCDRLRAGPWEMFTTMEAPGGC